MGSEEVSMSRDTLRNNANVTISDDNQNPPCTPEKEVNQMEGTLVHCRTQNSESDQGASSPSEEDQGYLKDTFKEDNNNDDDNNNNKNDKDSKDKEITKATTATRPSLLAAPETPSSLTSPKSSRPNEPSKLETIGKRSVSITLAVTIKFPNTNTHSTQAPINATLPANQCRSFADLRAQVVGTTWKTAGISSLGKATFRLEEDGKAASMTRAPTTIDDQTPLPAQIYAGWFQRILRGEQTVYKADVTLTSRGGENHFQLRTQQYRMVAWACLIEAGDLFRSVSWDQARVE